VTKDHAATLPHLPWWGGEENRKKKAKLVGQDKDSLREQQRKQTVTTTVLTGRTYKNKGIHKATLSHCPTPSVLPSHD